MANKKKEVYKPKPMTAGKQALIQGLLQEYDIETAEDIQDACNIFDSVSQIFLIQADL